VHADLIDGETAMHSPVNLRHADLLKSRKEREIPAISGILAQR
jgi:hypothetical protein